MSAPCTPMLPWPLSRRGQELIAWDVDGLPAGAVADIQLENSDVWRPLMINTERTVLSLWVAGPDFVSPASESVVVPTTSWAEIRVTAGATTIFLDGGYIELLP